MITTFMRAKNESTLSLYSQHQGTVPYYSSLSIMIESLKEGSRKIKIMENSGFTKK
jgi:hypothetical protein